MKQRRQSALPDVEIMVNREKKQLSEEYKQRPLTMGVFIIRNTINNKIFLASGQNLAGIMNRHKFELQHGSHKNKELQTDWNELGASNFAFEVVEQMDPPSVEFDVKQELRLMEDLWLAELKPFDEHGYNQPKLSRAEKLRRIAATRQQ